MCNYYSMWHYGNWIHSPLTFVGVVHSTWPSRAMWHMHAPSFNKWHKKKKKKKTQYTLHMLTHGEMWGCELTSLVVCINDKIRDIRKRNLTIRSDIWTTNIRFLGFQDIREWVILWRLILRSLGCSVYIYIYTYITVEIFWLKTIAVTWWCPESTLLLVSDWTELYIMYCLYYICYPWKLLDKSTLGPALGPNCRCSQICIGMEGGLSMIGRCVFVKHQPYIGPCLTQVTNIIKLRSPSTYLCALLNVQVVPSGS